jgi:hypothetical protein
MTLWDAHWQLPTRCRKTFRRQCRTKPPHRQLPTPLMPYVPEDSDAICRPASVNPLPAETCGQPSQLLSGWYLFAALCVRFSRGHLTVEQSARLHSMGCQSLGILDFPKRLLSLTTPTATNRDTITSTAQTDSSESTCLPDVHVICLLHRALA